jgi:excisionase family DNA binding protein
MNTSQERQNLRGSGYVPIEELSKHLAVSISTVRGWVRNKHIPENTYIRVGNTYRFSIDAVVGALSADKREPVISDSDGDI